MNNSSRSLKALLKTRVALPPLQVSAHSSHRSDPRSLAGCDLKTLKALEEFQPESHRSLREEASQRSVSSRELLKSGNGDRQDQSEEMKESKSEEIHATTEDPMANRDSLINNEAVINQSQSFRIKA